MATLSAEEKIEFLLVVIQKIEAAPDMLAVAQAMGIDKRPAARWRYKTIVEHSGKYLLTAENRIVLKEADGGDEEADDGSGPSSSSTPTKTNAKKRGRPNKKAATATIENASGHPAKKQKDTAEEEV